MCQIYFKRFDQTKQTCDLWYILKSGKVSDTKFKTNDFNRWIQNG